MEPQQLCPYLSTIKRHALDFDFEKICSVTLTANNVYGCLVCGRYFQGKASTTPAYEHSIETNHHMFINLINGRVYCLPDSYEVVSHTIGDIQFNLNPIYREKDLAEMRHPEVQYNIDGKEFTPGVVGLNDLRFTDYANAVFQLLNTVEPLREYFLLKNGFQDPLLDRFGMLIRKIWNRKQFKGAVSPHELMQMVADRSSKMYKIGKRSDPVQFLIWLIDNLSRALRKSKCRDIKLAELFQGSLKTSFIKGIKNSSDYESIPSKVEEKNFTVLRLEFPERGVFNKIDNQVEIQSMLQVYRGTKGKIQGEGLLYTQIKEYPRFLVLAFKRFFSSEFSTEKDNSNVIYGTQLEVQKEYYRLIGQICHEGTFQEGKYIAHVSMDQKWYICENLLVNEILKQQMLLGQPYLQMYELMR